MPASKLVIKFLKGQKRDTKMQFTTAQMPLTMGRDKSNPISFEGDK